MRSQLLLFLVLSLVQVLHGWRLPLPRTLLATNTRCGVAPSRAFHLYAIRRRMKSAAPVVQVGTPPCINEEITADPVRLIAPKVVPPPLIDESTVDEDSNEENDDDDDYDDSEEDVDDSEGEDEDAPKGFVSGEEMLGIYSLEDALQKAREFNLDLVMINDKADPPVCKIVNYGKYKYTIERRKKDNLKKQIRGDIKEVKMSYKIDTHDFDVRLRSAQRFIASGDRVSSF